MNENDPSNILSTRRFSRPFIPNAEIIEEHSEEDTEATNSIIDNNNKLQKKIEDVLV